MRWRSNRWTVTQWSEWWDQLSVEDQTYFGKLQTHFQNTSRPQTSPSSPTRKSCRGIGRSTRWSRPKHCRTSMPGRGIAAGAHLQPLVRRLLQARSQLLKTYRWEAARALLLVGTVRVGPPLTAAPAQIRSLDGQHVSGSTFLASFLFWLPNHIFSFFVVSNKKRSGTCMVSIPGGPDQA